MEVHHLNGASIIAALALTKGSHAHTKTILLTSNKASVPTVVKPDFTVVKDAQLHRNISKILQIDTRVSAY
jgi:hypothetical protein